jgi:hypothetical protein
VEEIKLIKSMPELKENILKYSCMSFDEWYNNL